MGRKPYTHDNLPPKMRKRIKAGGVAWYYLDKGKQPDGRRPEVALGNDYTEALRKYVDLVREGSRPPVTLPELLKKWQLETMAGRAVGTQTDIGFSVPNLITYFSLPSPAPLEFVQPVHIAQYIAWRSRGDEERGVRAAPVRANREVSWLSAAWNWGRSQGVTTLPNPCDGVRRNKEEDRDVYVEDDELEAIKAHADIPLLEALELAYLIGQRPGDLRALRETDIRNGVLTFGQIKTKKKMAIEVSGDLADLLARIQARKSAIKGVCSLAVLCDESGQALGKAQQRYRFDKAREAAAMSAKDAATAARIRATQFRDLRAKAGTDKRDTGSLDAAQGLLGHSQASMTERYTRARKGKLVKPVR